MVTSRYDVLQKDLLKSLEQTLKKPFSPVARFKTVQLLLALATLKDWEIEGLDVKTAFLFGDLDEEI